MDENNSLNEQNQEDIQPVESTTDENALDMASVSQPPVQRTATVPFTEFQNNTPVNDYNFSQTPPVQTVPVAPEYIPPDNYVKKTKNKGVYIFLTIICLLLVATISIVAVFLATNWHDNSNPFNKPVIENTEKDDELKIIKNSTPKVEYTVGEDKILSIPQIVKKVAPSVVGIKTNISTGTGIIMSTNGYVLTNDHVVDNATLITVIDNKGKEYEATLIGSDSITDVAVLKIEADNLAAAEFGDSDVLEVGETAVAIGNPFSLELYGTVTSGVISANDRKINVDGKDITLIQTDASINPGNSGGPLINHFGQVIGITSIKISAGNYEGLGFAIPINTVIPIVTELKDKGYISGRPRIGISVQDIDYRTAWYYNMPYGVYVTAVEEGSDAAKKGITQGDIITAVNGVAITSSAELSNQKDNYKAGDSITLTIYREGRYYQIDVILMENNGPVSQNRPENNS